MDKYKLNFMFYNDNNGYPFWERKEVKSTNMEYLLQFALRIEDYYRGNKIKNIEIISVNIVKD